jgi:hypothetical protein
MKKAMSIVIVLTMCGVVLCWAAWHGDTKHDGVNEGNVHIISCPTGLDIYSTSQGGYTADEMGGLHQDTYYYYLEGQKTIDGVFHQGKNWVQSVYDRNTPKYGLTINLDNVGDK